MLVTAAVRLTKTSVNAGRANAGAPRVLIDRKHRLFFCLAARPQARLAGGYRDAIASTPQIGVASPMRWSLFKPSVLRILGVDDGQASGFKWASVSRCNYQTMDGGRSGNVAICWRISFSLDPRTGTKHRVGFGGCCIKVQIRPRNKGMMRCSRLEWSVSLRLPGARAAMPKRYSARLIVDK